MKLYDSRVAPNPRRVRVFLAEKGVTIPTEQVDLGTLQQKSAAFSAVNPLQRVPALRNHVLPFSWGSREHGEIGHSH